MAKHVYEIHFGCFGNGLVAYDVNSTKHGDYENVAHIDSCGAYRLYKKLPEDVVALIVTHAKDEANHFRKQFINETLTRRADELDRAMTWEDCKAVKAAGINLYELSPDKQLAYYCYFFCKNSNYTPLPDMEYAEEYYNVLRDNL